MATNQSAKKPANKKLLLGAVIGLVLIAAIVVGICLLQPGESIRFNLEPQVLTLEVGQSRQMELKEGSDSIQLSWSSSSASVVTVDKAGLVTAVAPGEAKIVATASKDGKEYSATARVVVTGASLDKLSVTGDDVSDVQLVNRFEVDTYSSGIKVNKVAGTLTYDSTSNTEIFFAASGTETYARNWTMTGTVTKNDMNSSLFPSFGVRDENGKEQWFCILDNTMALQREWNWWKTIQEDDGYRVTKNDAASDFFFHKNPVLNYKVVLEGDVLKVYFGNEAQDLKLAWNLDLTYENYGHFDVGSSYQLAINTVDPCPMVISELDITTSNENKSAGSGKFNVYSVAGSFIPYEYGGKITYPGKGNTELVFAANNWATHAKNWEMTGTITKEDMSKGLFFSFGVIDAGGKEQWFCLLNESTLSLQRYWNWYDNRMFTDGENVIFNAAADAFFGGSQNTSAVLNYKVVLEGDVLKVYFGNDTQNLKLAWNLPLTEKTFGGFRSGSLYQLAINTVDPCPMTISNISVNTRNAERVFKITYEGVDGQPNTNPTSYTHATASTIVLADLPDKADTQFTGWYVNGERILSLKDQAGDITLTAGWGKRYFNVDSISGTVVADVNAGTLTYEGIGNTEVYFKATQTETYASDWDMTGFIKKEDINSSLFFSFGVRDSSGKDQWFCFLENGLSRQRYWNWWDTAVWPNNTTIFENSAQYAFFLKTSDVLNYRVSLKDDTLYVYFGSNPQDLQLTWILDLTGDTFGGFAAGSSYQLALNTVDPCAMTISDVSVATDEIYQGELDMDWDWHGANETTERTASYKATGNDGKTTVFIGDSFFSSNWWDNFYTDLAGKDAIIAGISGSTADDWIHYLKHGLFPTGIAPKNLVVNLGNNDIFNDVIGAEEALKNFQKLAQQLHEEMPDTNIYWFSITPRTENFIDDSTRIPMEQVNADMKQWCAEDAQSYITFVDISGEYIELQDKIHPKDEYYNTVFLAKLLEAGCQFEALTVDTEAKFFVDSKTGDITDNPRAGTLTYAGTGNTELYFKADAIKTHAKNWEMAGTITKANASTSLFMSFGVLDENGKEQWFCILNASSIALQRYWNWYENRVLPDGVNIIENAASTAFFGHENNTSAVLKYKVVLENDILSVYFGNDENELALAWYLPLTETKFGGFTAGSSYQLAINTVDPCPMTITEVTAKGSDEALDAPEEPEEPEEPVETVSVTWEYARVNDSTGAILYDMGQRRMTSGYVQAVPGMTITLDDADHHFILYAYSYDAATDTYTYAGGFIDCDPDSSSYYSTTYTFGESTALSDGTAAPEELYVRIVIKHTAGRKAIPETIQDAVTVTKPMTVKMAAAILPAAESKKKSLSILL